MNGPDRRATTGPGRRPSGTGYTTVPRLLVAVVVVLAAVGGAVVFVASQSDPEERPTVDSPGERLAGSVNAQTAEFEEEVDRRTLAARVDTAGGNASRGAVVAAEAAAVESRLGSVTEAFEAVDEARENGTLGEAAYRTRITRLVAESELLESRARYLATVAASLPAPVQEEYGVAPESLRALADRAGTLATAEQRSLARALAGDDVGSRFSDDDDTEDDADESEEMDDDIRDADDDTEDDADDAGDTDDNGEQDTDGGDPDADEDEGTTTLDDGTGRESAGGGTGDERSRADTHEADHGTSTPDDAGGDGEADDDTDEDEDSETDDEDDGDDEDED